MAAPFFLITEITYKFYSLYAIYFWVKNLKFIFFLIAGSIFLLFCSSGDVIKTSRPFVEDDFQGYSGLLAPSAGEYLKIEEAKMIRSFSNVDEVEFSKLPSQIDLSSDFPLASDQGHQNSCTAWVVSFAIKSFQEHREMGWDLNEDHFFSPSFVYNQINGGKDEGADLVDAMKFLMENGTIPYSLMPYKANDYLTQPNQTLKDLAFGFRVLGYRRIQEKNLSHLKSYLAAHEPVLIVVEMYPNFLPRGMKRSNGIYREKSGKLLGYHALVAVGYDDSRHAIKVLNSWGKNWGDGGYGWIDDKFFPTIIKQAFVMYDLPTPHQTFYQDAQTLLIVPDESGIRQGGKWLRLSDSLSKVVNFFNTQSSSIQIKENFLNKEIIGKMHFFPSTETVVLTNEGIGFKSTRKDVNRVYGKADYVDPANGDEIYFFHAVTSNWGGIPVTQNASLVFHFDDGEKVSFMGLESVFKKVAMGKGFEKLTLTEKGVNDEIISEDQLIRFIPPPQLTEIKKSVWEGTGYGYFLNNPDRAEEYLVVKVFQAGKSVTDEILKERIIADLKIYGFDSLNLKKTFFAGVDWKVLDLGNRRYYYTAVGSVFLQIQIAASQKLSELPWVSIWIASLKVKT